VALHFINVFPTLESKSLLADLLSLRTAWAVTSALPTFTVPPVVGFSMVGPSGSSMVEFTTVTVRIFSTVSLSLVGNVSVFKNKQMDIVLTANKRGVNFSITGDTQGDEAKFTLSGTKHFFNCLLVPSGSDRNRIVITITAIFIKVGGFKGKFSASQP
jgi:hypothetical protein